MENAIFENVRFVMKYREKVSSLETYFFTLFCTEGLDKRKYITKYPNNNY